MAGGTRPSAFDRWHRRLYRGGRPGRLARAMNAFSAAAFARGWADWSGRGVTLEVRGCTSGQIHMSPLVMLTQDGHCYLVSMLGPDAAWVRNVRADGGRAVLRRRGRVERVRLAELDPAGTAALLAAYARIAPGARPHLPFTRASSPAEIAAVADRVPVFEVGSAA